MARLIHVLSKSVWIVQAVYYTSTGVIPLVAMRLFLLITGPKTDLWLVKTVGAIVTVIGAVIGSAGMRKRITPEIEGLGIGSAASLAAIDVWYGGRGRISKIYLLDALANLLIIAGWITRRRRTESRP